MGFVVGVLMYDFMNPQHKKAERFQLNIFGYLDSGCALIEHKKNEKIEKMHYLDFELFMFRIFRMCGKCLCKL